MENTAEGSTRVEMGQVRDANGTGVASPVALGIAEKGIRTAGDFARFMSGLMSDLISGRVTPQVGNAACNAGGKLLKVVEMQQRYGTKGDGPQRELLLASD